MTTEQKLKIALDALEEMSSGPYYPPNTAVMSYKQKYEAFVLHSKTIKDQALLEINKPTVTERNKGEVKAEKALAQIKINQEINRKIKELGLGVSIVICPDCDKPYTKERNQRFHEKTCYNTLSKQLERLGDEDNE